MSGGLVDKVYIGLDNAPAAFDIKGRILGPNGTNLEYIRSETGVVAVLKNEKYEPLHLALHHTRSEALSAARSLAQNLIETIRAELAQWTTAQSGTQPPSMSVPPPSLVTTPTSVPPPPVPPPIVSMALSNQSTLTSTAPPSVLPPVSVATATAPLMTVRQPTVLQLLPQQQYVLNQENGQLIPIVHPGVQMSNGNFSSLPFAQSLNALQQPNFGGTQLVDLSSMQPVNVTQLRLSGVPNSMPMILPNGLSFPQVSLTTTDTTTVSSATSTPVVCAAQNTNASQKILYSADKGDKMDTVQWTVPGAQTMLIPYQQLQEFGGNHGGLTNLQPQQFVSIAPAGGLPQTSLSLTAAQLQQLQGGGTIMQFNQKPIVSSGSLINIISTGQASSPHIIPGTTKNVSAQESRGQKRLSDGSPSQLQLRPIAPAGSHVNQDKNTSRDSRSWTAAAGRDTTVVSMGMKINPSPGTIIHVSSGQQTNLTASAVTQDGTGMYIRQIDKNTVQTSKDGQKQELHKLQTSSQNVQMITVPQGMSVLQNPLNIGQTVFGQPNSQVYMIPANQANLMQGSLPAGFQQMLQSGQNVTVMQPNQLSLQNNVQYNVPLMPMNVAHNSQYMQAGLNLNTPLTAQQLNAALAGHQLANSNLAGAIPIVQAPPGTQLTNHAQNIPVTQPVQQMLAQNSTYVTPTSQYAGMQSQYMVQSSTGALTIPNNNTNVQYNMTSNQNANTAQNNPSGQTNATPETDTSNVTANQANYITSSQDNNYLVPSNTNVQNTVQQNFQQDGAAAQTSNFTAANQHSFPAANTNNTQNSAYNVTQQPSQQTNYNPANGSSQPNGQFNQNTVPTTQSTPQASYSPSSTPSSQGYPESNLTNMTNVTYQPNQNQQNPYPNAYAGNQYQYTSRPWFRPRYGVPQGSPYKGTPQTPNGTPMSVPPPSGNFNYWQDS